MTETNLERITEHAFNLRIEARAKNAELIKARESLGLTIKAASEAMDVHYGSLVSIECLSMYPSERIQKKICDFYRKQGHFMMEEDIFPYELKTIKAKKVVLEREIPRKNMLSLNGVDERLIPKYTLDNHLTAISDDEMVRKIKSLLTEREHAVLAYGFGLENNDQHTHAEIASKLNISAAQIRNIEKKALDRIQKFFNKDGDFKSDVLNLNLQAQRFISISKLATRRNPRGAACFDLPATFGEKGRIQFVPSDTDCVTVKYSRYWYAGCTHVDKVLFDYVLDKTKKNDISLVSDMPDDRRLDLSASFANNRYGPLALVIGRIEKKILSYYEKEKSNALISR